MKKQRILSYVSENWVTVLWLVCHILMSISSIRSSLSDISLSPMFSTLVFTSVLYLVFGAACGVVCLFNFEKHPKLKQSSGILCILFLVAISIDCILRCFLKLAFDPEYQSTTGQVFTCITLALGIISLVFSIYLIHYVATTTRAEKAWKRVLTKASQKEATAEEVTRLWHSYWMIYGPQSDAKVQALQNAWEHGHAIHARYCVDYDGRKVVGTCLVNLETKQVFDIDLSSYADKNSPLDSSLLGSEYIYINGSRYPLVSRDWKDCCRGDVYWYEYASNPFVDFEEDQGHERK